MQIIGFLLCFLVIIAAFPRLYDVFTKHMEKMADDELQKYMQANKVLHADGATSPDNGLCEHGAILCTICHLGKSPRR